MEEQAYEGQPNAEEQKVAEVAIEPTTPETGKPKGLATIVEDAPIEQFPAHDENISS